MKLKAHDVALLALAVVTAGAIWLALGSVGAPSPEGPAVSAEQSAQPSGDEASDPEASAGESVSASSSTDGSESGEQDQAQTSQEPSSAQEQFARVLAGADGEPVDVVVLRDDTSNLRSEWVQLWGQGLSDFRPVSVVQWDELVDIMYAEPDVLSERGEGGQLTIWSASRTGADIESVDQRLGYFLEPDPDLVLISLGANNDDPSQAVQQMEALVEELRDRIGDTPLALVRQGQGVATDDVDQALADWAQEQGLLVIDASSADTAQDWAELVNEQTSAAG